MISGWSSTKVGQTDPVSCISRLRGQKIGFFKCNSQKSSYLKLQGPDLSFWYIASSRGPLPKLFKLCSWGLNWPCPGGHNFTLNYMREVQRTSLEPLMGLWPNSTGMVPGWSPTKIVQMVLIGCRSRSQGQKNAIFKNLLDWNYKAQIYHIWYIASSRGPLPKLFKLCPWG